MLLNGLTAVGPIDIAQRRLVRVAGLSASALGLIGLYCIGSSTVSTSPSGPPSQVPAIAAELALDELRDPISDSTVRQADLDVDPQTTSASTVEQVGWMSRWIDPMTKAFGRSQQSRAGLPASAKIGPLAVRRQGPGIAPEAAAGDLVPSAAQERLPSDPPRTTAAPNAVRRSGRPPAAQQPPRSQPSTSIAVGAPDTRRAVPSATPVSEPRSRRRSSKPAHDDLTEATAAIRSSAPSRLQPDQMIEPEQPEQMARVSPAVNQPSFETPAAIRQTSRLNCDSVPTGVTPVPSSGAPSQTTGLRERARHARENGQESTARRLEAAANQIDALTGPVDPPRPAAQSAPRPVELDDPFVEPTPTAIPAAPSAADRTKPGVKTSAQLLAVPKLAAPARRQTTDVPVAARPSIELTPRISSLQSWSRRLPSLTEGRMADLSANTSDKSTADQLVPEQLTELVPQIPSPPGWSAATKLGGSPAPTYEPIQIQSHSIDHPITSARRSKATVTHAVK